MNYNNIETTSIGVIRECMIKSCLVLMSDEGINKEKELLNELLSDKEYNIIFPNSNISENIIINCFKNITEEKNKIKRLSLQ